MDNQTGQIVKDSRVPFKDRDEKKGVDP